jgi:hypothetical protein
VLVGRPSLTQTFDESCYLGQPSTWRAISHIKTFWSLPSTAKPPSGGLDVKGKKEEKEVVVLFVSSDHKLT